MKRQQKRILITGGAGFIGSHLCKSLLREGHEVLCVDNFYTGEKQNVIHLMDNPNFEIIRHDITNPLDIEIDQIYNLACAASPVHYQAVPIHTIKTSVIGTLNMVELATRVNARILQASTSEIYGDPLKHPQNENYWGNVNPIGPRACYDEGKRCAETLLFDYHREKNVSIAIARIFNTYGPQMHPDDGRVISNFIVQALKGNPITIYGNGSQTRSFCFIEDLVPGLISLMNSGNKITGPLNLGNSQEFTILEVANIIIELTGSSSKITHKKLPIDDPKRRNPDLTKAKEILNWEPKTTIEDGLKKTIPYFDNILSFNN
jgi:UDP-glucuronate decarboxylase